MAAPSGCSTESIRKIVPFNFVSKHVVSVIFWPATGALLKSDTFRSMVASNSGKKPPSSRLRFLVIALSVPV